VAPLDVRRERNRSENRRRKKNAYWVTDESLHAMHIAHRYDGGGTFPVDLPHLRVQTKHLPADASGSALLSTSTCYVPRTPAARDERPGCFTRAVSLRLPN
jgi:hypothetical protein